MLLGAVVDAAVLFERAPRLDVDHSFVGHQVRERRDLRAQNSADVLAIDVRNMEGARGAVTLDERHDFHFVVPGASALNSGEIAPVGFVRLNDSA